MTFKLNEGVFPASHWSSLTSALSDPWETSLAIYLPFCHTCHVWVPFRHVFSRQDGWFPAQWKIAKCNNALRLCRFSMISVTGNYILSSFICHYKVCKGGQIAYGVCKMVHIRWLCLNSPALPKQIILWHASIKWPKGWCNKEDEETSCNCKRERSPFKFRFPEMSAELSSEDVCNNYCSLLQLNAFIVKKKLKACANTCSCP